MSEEKTDSTPERATDATLDQLSDEDLFQTLKKDPLGIPKGPLFPVSVSTSGGNRWWLSRFLRVAAEKKDAEAYHTVLAFWLMLRLRVPIPEGVFVYRRSRGRPIDETTEFIYETWKELGKPSLTSQKLAAAWYGKDFANASAKERKRMIDRCRAAVRRYKEPQVPD